VDWTNYKQRRTRFGRPGVCRRTNNSINKNWRHQMSDFKAKNAINSISTGVPQTPPGELTALPRPQLYLRGFTSKRREGEGRAKGRGRGERGGDGGERKGEDIEKGGRNESPTTTEGERRREGTGGRRREGRQGKGLAGQC